MMNNNFKRISSELDSKRLNITESEKEKNIKWETRMEIPASLITVPDYQRTPINEEFIKEKVKNFNTRCIRDPKVSYRNGEYSVIDGQHTIEIIKRYYKDDNYPIPCVVYYGYSYVDDALLFAQQNEDKNKVKIYNRLRALKIGEDKEICDFYNVTEECGFKIGYTPSSYYIRAIRKALDIYKQCGKELYKRMLKLLDGAWHGNMVSLQQNMLAGLAIVLKAFGDDFSDNAFIKTFSLISIEQVLQKAKGIKSKNSYMSNPIAHANSIIELYNRNRTENNRLDIFKLGNLNISKKVSKNTLPVNDHFSTEKGYNNQ